MSLLDERGTGAISWQRNLAVLWCGVFFACASYTMVVPFLHHLEESVKNSPKYEGPVSPMPNATDEEGYNHSITVN